MNKIVKEHYPASKLPVELREGIEASALVTVTIQEEVGRKEPPSREELRQLIEQAQRDAQGVTMEEAVARIRTLRDEWDD
jgi:hypothetical protein